MKIQTTDALFLLALSSAGLGQSASAAVVTDTVTFTASGFTSVFGQPVPTDPVQGSFAISFDPTQTYTNATAGITFGTLNIALGSPLSFDYSPTTNGNGLADELVVGGLNAGAGTINFSTADFYLHIYNFTAGPTFQQLGYTLATDAQQYFYNDPFNGLGSGSVTVTPVTGGVPEPSTWAMLLTGFAGLSFISYRRAHRAILGQS